MRYLVIGDPHYKKHNKEETDILEQEVSDLITKLKPDQLVILGDMLDRFALKPLCRASEWLLRLSKRLPTILIVGNHDRENNMDFQSDIHPFVGIKDTVTIISQATLIDNILFVPYVAVGRFHEAIGTIDISKVKLVFCHQSFIGCSDPKSIDEWMYDLPVISGHIHSREAVFMGSSIRMASEDKNLPENWNVYYPGAPLCNNVGDDYSRYVCSVDMEDEITVAQQLLEKVPPRYIVNVTMEDPNEEIVCVADKYARLDIRGTLQECSVLRRRASVIAAVKRGSKLKTFHTDNITYSSTHKKRTTFSDLLVERLRESLTSSEFESMLKYIS